MIARAGLQTIPIAGGAAAEFFNAIISPPLEKRRQEWMEEVAECLRKLEESKGISLDDLIMNEVFTTTVMQASQSAIRNHQKEKIDALRNAVLNAALPTSPNDSLQQMFLNFVDTFTVWHIRLLKFFDNPAEGIKAKGLNLGNITMGGLSHILEEAFPELKGERAFYDQVWKDLYSRGLVNTEGLHTMMSGSGLMAQRATPMGRQFIEFITSPI